MSDNNVMIDLQNVSKWYEQFQVLTECTTQIRQGEVVVVCGPSGSGKSTFFKRLAASAELKGIDTEIYHCGFDSNSLDMLIFPELSLAIFDSTAPHEHFPSRDGDRIIDVYELAIEEGTDEKFADAILTVKNRYSTSMKQSISHLAEVEELCNKLKDIYREAAGEGSLFPLEKALLSGIEARV
jgi:energy-coupling factor transporter ATP-binding protein EcfA2